MSTRDAASAPAFSSATKVFSKVGAAGLLAMLLDFGQLLAHACVVGRGEIAVLDPGEIRRLERQGARFGERIAGRRGRTGRRLRRQGGQGCAQHGGERQGERMLHGRRASGSGGSADFTRSTVGARAAAPVAGLDSAFSLPGKVMTQASMKRAKRIRAYAGTAFMAMGLALVVASAGDGGRNDPLQRPGQRRQERRPPGRDPRRRRHHPVDFIFKDNGRGPELKEEYTLAADGTFTRYHAKGTSTFGARR